MGLEASLSVQCPPESVDVLYFPGRTTGGSLIVINARVAIVTKILSGRSFSLSVLELE